MGQGASADRVLVERMVAGDDHALARAYDLHAPMVFGLARRVIGDDEAAREVSQEVFTLLWEHPDRVDLSRGTLKSYLGVIAHRRAVDAVRRSVRRRQAESGMSGRAAVVDAGHDTLVLDRIAGEWQSSHLRALIDRLPDDEREALVLAYYGGRTYREVAEVLSIPEGTAKSRLRRALERLRTAVREDLPAWAP